MEAIPYGQSSLLAAAAQKKRVLNSIPLTPGYVLNSVERISFMTIRYDVMIRYDRPPSYALRHTSNTHTGGVRNLPLQY